MFNFYFTVVVKGLEEEAAVLCPPVPIPNPTPRSNRFQIILLFSPANSASVSLLDISTWFFITQWRGQLWLHTPFPAFPNMGTSAETFYVITFHDIYWWAH